MSSPRMYRFALVALLAAAPSLAAAADLDWPRQFDTPSGSFVIYQPQPEDLQGDELTGRAAFSLKKTDGTERTYGVLWYTERISIDRDSSTVSARSLDVTKVRLPGITPEEASRYESLVESQARGWDLSLSVEELQAGLAAAEKERASVDDIDNTPPKILFHDRRAILVVYDGDPLLEPIQGSSLQRVVNTPYAVVLDPRSHTYYLNGGNLWYRAKDPLGPWTDISNPPAAVRAVVPPDTLSSDVVEGPPPEVLTATEPTELIATDGPPEYASLVQDELLYVTNTESDVVLEVETQDLYVLISGRWFRAPSTDGPWTFVRGDELPASFKRVPPDSPKGNILASVAGTDLAEDAMADAEIPQTSAIRRDDQSLQVTYDGDPDFEPIEGTELEYAVNTDAEVILADGRYYACDQGVWYIADDPDGPWSVSDTRPLGLEEIPPSCPVYDVRYVYVYEATPEVVYVGYLPGYLGWYPYYGTVVYGTGYQYNGWRGRHHFYPRRFTWGIHARYNPWLGRWSFGFSYSTGFLRVGSRWRSDASVPRTRTRSAWFGPGGFRRPLVSQDMALLRTRPQRRVRAAALEGLPSNLYNRTENVTRVDRVRNRAIARPIVRPSPVPNDVFGGKDGRVYRREGDGTWQVRTGSEWKPTNVPVLPPATTTQREREETPLPPAKPMPPRESRRRGEPAVERPAPPRNIPTERPVPSRERPEPPRERPMPQEERTTPPRERPAPGNLEREYRARERSNREDKPEAPPPAVRPTLPSEEPKDKKSEEPKKERTTQRLREDVKRDRGR
ncbi:MAG TPA: carbohydrate-binding family V/XII [Candidatus Eisenbacteria bacterium]|nr:carbohydrate-binding family V/XII [Candidatus Eisenbacteria bacterium]